MGLWQKGDASEGSGGKCVSPKTLCIKNGAGGEIDEKGN